MLLIIENRDDPTEPIAAETEGGSELVYIPVVTAPAESDDRKRAVTSAADRLRYELRESGAVPPDAHCTEKLVPLFLKALGRTGKRPVYLSPPAEQSVFGAEPRPGGARLYARG